ncbi:MAG: class I SAM-dependent methyltransferase [Sphingosinicella sp.]|nr:class I SAM-dependent methyltransferase [Sphingosinicella sp.]
MRGFKAFLLGVALAMPACGSSEPANIPAAVASNRRPDMKLQDAGRKPVEVMNFLGLRKGDRALDVVSGGGGYYAELMGKAVGPTGSVVAWEPEAFVDAAAKIRLKDLRERVPNVEVLTSPWNPIPLKPNSFDFVLMHMIYHEFYWESAQYKIPRVDPDKVLRNIFAATRPGGVVGVVDHSAKPGGNTRNVVDKLHRIDPAVVRADFVRAGFVFEGESPVLRNPGDDLTKLIFDPAIRGKTDRFVYRFRKPK